MCIQNHQAIKKHINIHYIYIFLCYIYNIHINILNIYIYIYINIYIYIYTYIYDKLSEKWKTHATVSSYLLDTDFITSFLDWTVFWSYNFDHSVHIIWMLFDPLAMEIDWLVSLWFGCLDRSVYFIPCIYSISSFVYLFVLCYICFSLLR